MRNSDLKILASVLIIGSRPPACQSGFTVEEDKGFELLFKYCCEYKEANISLKKMINIRVMSMIGVTNDT